MPRPVKLNYRNGSFTLDALRFDAVRSGTLRRFRRNVPQLPQYTATSAYVNILLQDVRQRAMPHCTATQRSAPHRIRCQPTT